METGSKTPTEQLAGRIIRTILIVFVARLGNYIPIPGITEVDSLYESTFRDSSVFNLSSFSGGSNVMSIFTLGLGPFFSASILVQFLTKLYPPFERLQNDEGDTGRRQIIKYTRLFSVLFSFAESFYLSNSLRSFVFNWTFNSYFIVALSLSAGSLILVWLSEIITERGVGNGSSILILVGNLARCPEILLNKTDLDADGFSFFNPTYIFYMVCTFFIMLVLSSITQEGSRKLPVLSPKQILGRDISLTKSSYIPIRFGQAGVVPIIFSSSILLFLSGLIKKSENIFPIVNSISNPYFNQFIYFVAFLTIIVLFSSFYSLILLNPEDIAKNLSKMSSIIKDVKPGVKTKIHLRKSILEASFIGALLLSFLIIIPFVLAVIVNVPSFSISGITSMILCLSIINDTARQILAYFETRVFLFIP